MRVEPVETPSVALIVVAAGVGSRLGAVQPKALVPLGTSTILRHSLSGLSALELQVIVVGPAGHLDACRREALAAGIPEDRLRVVAGGAERQHSVLAGLAVLDPAVDIVLVHDAARALTPPSQFRAVIGAVRDSGVGVVPTMPVTDTVRWVGSSGLLGDTVDRARLAAMQTPQGFPRDLLDAAYRDAPAGTTDDAAVWAASGRAVTAIAGDPAAFKITTPADFARAEQLVEAAVQIRTGVGIDVHAYSDAAPLWLAGLHWPGEPGLAGHSDGDAVAHAICDALLSAAGLGDIGGRFGTADPAYADAAGEVFLTATRVLLSDAGFRIGNVSVQLIGNTPRLGPRRLEAEQRLSEILGAPVSLSATTSDGLGFTGRGEGLTAIATALVQGS
jgi:2-C-methyl-D-erythritol 4-phosphate cytidylyltransferase/2-C-methyl-D-erythritol 2,4-cyclodiphosphate synthase